MSDLLSDLKKHYNLLLQERAAIDMNLLKIKELIALNEKIIVDEKDNREEIIKSSQSTLSNREENKKISQQILQQREELQNKPSQPKAPTGKAPGTNAGGQQYDANMNWQQKIAVAMRLMGKPATAREIAVKIKELEPNSQLSVDKSVELTTSRMHKNGEIAARKEGVKNYYSLLHT